MGVFHRLLNITIRNTAAALFLIGLSSTINYSGIKNVDKPILVNKHLSSGKTQSPANIFSSPEPPVLINPPDQSAGNPTGVSLSIQVSDPDLDQLEVTYYGRKKLNTENEFTIIGLPDTQYYTGELNGGTPAMFYSQTQWITDNLNTENIVFVSHFGDCVENGDDIENEWEVVDEAMSTIEDPSTTLLDDGIPFALTVGNHDQSPWGDPAGTTLYFNAYFGEDRFDGRNYYGGHYGTNNDNSYQLFSAGGMDFITIHLEYDQSADAGVLTWADNLLSTHSSRRAIIVSHYLITPGNPGNFGAQGQAIYDQFKDNENVFLMLGGHFPGEGQRSDTFNGNTINTLLANYQNLTGGGNGWMRLMRFFPSQNLISVKTYSPWLDQYETDSNSEFTLSYDMSAAGYASIGTLTNIESGDVATINWENLDPNTEYEWYAVISDGAEEITSPVWSFTTSDHRLDLKVFLEGPFEGDAMLISLHDILPSVQPYSSEPWLYSGTENVAEVPPDVVDWVLVELREATQASGAGAQDKIFEMAAFISNDGQIVDLDGISPLSFDKKISKDLFVVIRHRNHLDILSAYALTSTLGVYAYNFTTGSEQVFGGTTGYSQLGSALWGMTAGDSNGDGIISIEDKNSWSGNAGSSSYINDDLNLDIQADNSDKNIWWLNNMDKYSLIPD